MDVTFTVNGLDLHRILSTYNVSSEMSYANVIQTLNGTEIPFPNTPRIYVQFSLWPIDDDAQTEELYSALSEMIFPVEFSNPYSGQVETKTFRVMTNLELVFALKSVNGKHYYKGTTIELRAL